MFFVKQGEVKKLHFCLSEAEKDSILEEAKQILVGVRLAQWVIPVPPLWPCFQHGSTR